MFLIENLDNVLLSITDFIDYTKSDEGIEYFSIKNPDLNQGDTAEDDYMKRKIHTKKKSVWIFLLYENNFCIYNLKLCYTK